MKESWKAFVLLVLCARQTPMEADTLVVRAPDDRQDVAALLPGSVVSERYCQDRACIVIPANARESAALAAMEAHKQITVEHLPEAHKIFFRHAVYDGDTNTFDRDFPGRTEINLSTPDIQVALVFKAFLQPQWALDILSAGFAIGEPLSATACRVYGPRASLPKLLSRAPYILKALEIPAGLKRADVDVLQLIDNGGPAPTTVTIFDLPSSPAKQTLVDILGHEPPIAYRMGSTTAYELPLTPEDALAISAYPDVVATHRQVHVASPSDERVNRIIGGDWRVPGSSWPLTLNANPGGGGQPFYWDSYVGSLAGLGVNLSNQTIGFLDTGVDVGLQEPGVSNPCPPALKVAPNGCRLVTTTDATTEFSEPNTRANDYYSHGTFTTALAAGSTNVLSARDPENYSLAQGVAPGASVAMAKVFNSCMNPTADPGGRYREVQSGGVEPRFSLDNMQRLVRYALVELSRAHTELLPDGVLGGGATIFNHSWNSQAAPSYDDVAVLID